MKGTYCGVGVEILGCFLPGGLEIEGCKRASFTLNLFFLRKNILEYCTDFQGVQEGSSPRSAKLAPEDSEIEG